VVDYIRLGFALIFLGIALAFIAALLPAIAIPLTWPLQPGEAMPTPTTRTGGGVGGCILLFFVPICFGYGVGHLPITLVIVSLILAAVVALIAYFTLRYLVPKPRIGGSP